MEMLAGGAVLLVLGVATGELGQVHLQAVSLRSALALFYLIVFGSLVAFTAYIWLLRHAPVARVATYAYVNPVVAVLLGWAFDHEQLSVRTLLAAAIIVAGGGRHHHIPLPSASSDRNGKSCRRSAADAGAVRWRADVAQLAAPVPAQVPILPAYLPPCYNARVPCVPRLSQSTERVFRSSLYSAKEHVHMSDVTLPERSGAPSAGTKAVKRAGRYAAYVFWLMFIINFLNYLDRWVFTGLSPVIQRDLRLDDFQIGLLATGFLLVYTVVAMPLGFLADRRSRKGIVGLGVSHLEYSDRIDWTGERLHYSPGHPSGAGNRRRQLLSCRHAHAGRVLSSFEAGSDSVALECRRPHRGRSRLPHRGAVRQPRCLATGVFLHRYSRPHFRLPDLAHTGENSPRRRSDGSAAGR